VWYVLSLADTARSSISTNSIDSVSLNRFCNQARAL
jgi:hypothetical protein